MLWKLTRHLLLPVARDGADDGVHLARDAVDGALNVILRLGGVVLGLALDVLFPPGLLPGLGAGQVADRLDGRALEGVVLARGLAGRTKSETYRWRGGHEGRTWARQCWPCIRT